VASAGCKTLAHLPGAPCLVPKALPCSASALTTCGYSCGTFRSHMACHTAAVHCTHVNLQKLQQLPATPSLTPPPCHMPCSTHLCR
jgi:hypothetical protein